jgi:G patch domain-containing protein 1
VLGKRKLTADEVMFSLSTYLNTQRETRQRGAILGEIPLPSTRSVFDYLSKEDRERVEHAAAGIHPPASDSTPTPVEARPTPTGIPYTASHIASAALKGFMPFTNDPTKQARYVAYLRSQTTPDHPELLPPKLPGQTPEAYHKELSDYSKSAAIFKPVSGAMASRFTTAAVVDTGPKAIEGLHQPTHEPEPTPTSQQEEKELEKNAPQPDEEVQSAKANAARTGMYGALTREVEPWQPSRLLCKRFGVKDPNPDITTDTPMPGVSNTGGGNAWKAEEALAEADLQTATGSTDADLTSPVGRRTTRDLENVGLGEDESQGRDTLTYVRPSMDIFKAIFASDDEDSDDDAEEDGGQEKCAPAPASPDPGPSTLPKRREEEQRTGNAADVKSVPAHFRTHNTADQTPTYEPHSVNRPPASMAIVDTATFKPVFVPRAERETQKITGDKRDGTSRGKDNKKRTANAIVSFEEDEGAALVIAPQAADKDKDKDKSRRKKKRRKEKGSANAEGPGEEEDAEMWIEKVPPQVVANFATTSAPPPPPTEKEVRMTGKPADPSSAESTSIQVAEGPSRGRKRAIDFL